MLFFFQRIPSCVVPAKAGIQNFLSKCNWQPYLANKLLKNLKKYFNNSTAGHQLSLVRRIPVFKIESARNKAMKQSKKWIASPFGLAKTGLRASSSRAAKSRVAIQKNMLFFLKRIPSCVMPAKAGIQNLCDKYNWQPYLAKKSLTNLKKYFNNSTAGHQLSLVRRIPVFKIEPVRNTKQSVFWIASHSKLVMTTLAFIIFLSYNAYSANEGLSNDNQPIEILSDMLRYIPSQNLAIFTGTVETTQGTMKLYCDIMKVEFYKKESNLKTTSSNKIKKIHVDGNVILITPTEKAEAERGEYDEKSSLLYLFDNVKLYQGENLLKGDKLTYSTITGESLLSSNQISKRVTGIFIQKKENDQ